MLNSNVLLLTETTETARDMVIDQIPFNKEMPSRHQTSFPQEQVPSPAPVYVNMAVESG